MTSRPPGHGRSGGDRIYRGETVVETELCTIVQRFYDEAFNNGNMKVLPELIAPEHVSHLPSGDHYGCEGVRIDISSFRTAFAGLHLRLDEVFSAGPRVVYRFTATGIHAGAFMGIMPTGRPVNVSGMGIDMIANEKLIERWIQYDSAGLLQQLCAPRV